MRRTASVASQRALLGTGLTMLPRHSATWKRALVLGLSCSFAVFLLWWWSLTLTQEVRLDDTATQRVTPPSLRPPLVVSNLPDTLRRTSGPSARDGVGGALSFSAPHADHADPDVVERMFGKQVVHVTLTTFWGLKTPGGNGTSSFYHGRAVPSFDWVVVFIASWVRHVCYGGKETVKSLEATVSPCPSGRRLIFFCDAITASSIMIRLAMARQVGENPGEHLKAVLNCACVFFVVVRDPSLGGRDRDELHARIMREGGHHRQQLQELFDKFTTVLARPAYMDERWVTSVPNGANNFRFAFYRDWLAEWSRRRRNNNTTSSNNPPFDEDEDDTTRVMISDNTDVAFQRNPFLSVGLNGCFPASTSPSVATRPIGGAKVLPWAVFTLEDASKSFKNEKYNRRWVNCYGKGGVLRAMEGRRQRISCAGVTSGNGEGVLRYCRAQLRELSRSDLVECAASTIHATLDQATHNVLLHRWLTWATSAYEVDRMQSGAGSSLPPLPVGRQGSGHNLNRWLLRKVASRDRLFPGNENDDVRFAIFTATAEFDQTMEEDVVPAGRGAVASSGRSEWIPCAFHGNFGRPMFAQRPPVEDGSGLAEDGVAASIPGVTSYPWYSVVHQYTSDRIPAMMERMRRQYL